MGIKYYPSRDFDNSDAIQLASDIVAAAPAALNTLDELAAAIGDDASFAATITTQIAAKQSKTPVDIPSGANLNDYTQTGFYHQSFNSKAAAGTNYPYPEAGLLSVVEMPTAMIYQTYQTFSSGSNRVWFRGRYETTWSSWKQLSSGGNITISTADPSGGMNGDVWLKYS